MGNSASDPQLQTRYINYINSSARNRFKFEPKVLNYFESKNSIKIANWHRQALYKQEKKSIILESTLYFGSKDNTFILQVERTSIDQFSITSITEITIEFKYQDLLLCSEAEILKDIVLMDHDEKYILNIYAKYVCYLIQDYFLKRGLTEPFPSMNFLDSYLPTDLSRIIQTYNLADNFILKNTKDSVDINLNDWVNEWTLITGTESMESAISVLIKNNIKNLMRQKEDYEPMKEMIAMM